MSVLSNVQKEHKEEMNHLAYEDVADIRTPRYTDDEEYMKAYRFWANIDPKRFDPCGYDSEREWDDY